MSIRPNTPAALNVLLGWLGCPIPPMPKHRNKTRASYRKTTRRRATQKRVQSARFSAALLAALDDADLDALAERLAPRLTDRLSSAPSSTAWLTVPTAAEHLSCPPSRLYALVSARRIPFHKDGSRTLFRREELDEWVRNGGEKAVNVNGCITTRL